MPTAQIDPSHSRACSSPTYHATPASNPPQLGNNHRLHHHIAVTVTAAADPQLSHGGLRVVPPCSRRILILRGHLSPAPAWSSGRRLRPLAVASLLLSPPRFPCEAPSEPLRSQRRSHDAASGGVQGLHGSRCRPRRP
jgi:hypothetical protein